MLSIAPISSLKRRLNSDPLLKQRLIDSSFLLIDIPNITIAAFPLIWIVYYTEFQSYPFESISNLNIYFHIGICVQLLFLPFRLHQPHILIHVFTRLLSISASGVLFLPSDSPYFEPKTTSFSLLIAAGLFIHYLHVRVRHKRVMEKLKSEVEEHRDEAARVKETLEQLKKYNLDQKFYVINLLSEVFDIHEFTVYRKAVEETGSGTCMTFLVNVVKDASGKYEMCWDADDRKEKDVLYLVCLSLMGFDLIICGAFDTAEEAIIQRVRLSTQNIKKLLTQNSSQISMALLLQFRELKISKDQTLDFDTSEDSEFFKSVRQLTRFAWVRHCEKRQECKPED